jgi:hypothetical protein
MTRPSIPNDCYWYPATSYLPTDPMKVTITGRVRSRWGWLWERYDLVCPLERVATIKHSLHGVSQARMTVTPIRK